LVAEAKPAPDPIDESLYPGDPEGDAKEELTQVQAGFRERMKEEADRFSHATMTDYYCVVAMETGEQMTALLQALGLKGNELFVDGNIITDALGVKVPEAPKRKVKLKKIDMKLASLVKKPAK